MKLSSSIISISLWLLASATTAAAFTTPSLHSHSILATKSTISSNTNTNLFMSTTISPPSDSTVGANNMLPDSIDPAHPLQVMIAGAGVGGLALANVLAKNPNINVTIFERTQSFKRFGGPIQLASNALEVLKTMDEDVYDQVLTKFTFTGNKMNGIKDGIRDEWYATFDLKSPADARGMPYTGVIERPDLQELYLNSIPAGVLRNGNGVVSYTKASTNSNTNNHNNRVVVELDNGETMEGDVLIGADGIWSAVRATMNQEPTKGDGSGASYSGYTVFAGELNYDSFDNGKVGYKVYIGPGQYFVITDIGNGRYQWYAFLARPPGSAETVEKPEGSSSYLQGIFEGWSKDIHHILKATKEDEIEQRDLYDRPPSVRKPWTDGHVALLGDAVHAMMPNLGQGGCQAMEDAYVLAQELESVTSRSEIASRLDTYRNRRLIRSAAVQGLSRFASDIIIRGFDTPAKIYFAGSSSSSTNNPEDYGSSSSGGGLKIENFNYAGIVTKLLQPILPLFFTVQFNFLYDGWKNEAAIDVKAAFGFLILGGLILLLGGGALGEAGGVGLFGLDAILGGEGMEAIMANFQDFF